MPRLFGRDIKVTAYRATPWRDGTVVSTTNGVIIRENRMTFQIDKDGGENPNKCELVIFNLAASTRVEITRKPLRVLIEAGYDGARQLMFVGDLQRGWSTKQGTEWETHLELGDGSRATSNGRVRRAYPPRTSVRTALRDVAGSMGLTLPNTLNIDPDLEEQFSTGVTLTGASRDAMSRLLEPYGYRWSIQNGQLQILKLDEVLPGRAFLLAEPFLRDSPEWTTPSKPTDPPKLGVKLALDARMSPGVLVRVESREVNGTFKLDKVSHQGDTDGGDWLTEAEATAK